MLIRFLLIIALLACPAFATAGQKIDLVQSGDGSIAPLGSVTKILHSAETGTADGETITVDGYSTLVMQVTLTDATVSFLGTQNGSTWVAVPCTRVNDTTGELITSYSDTATVRCNVAGLVKFKAPTSDNSGSVTATATASSGVAGGGAGGGGGGGGAVTQSGNWDIRNVTGTVSLPTGAATAALQDGIIKDGSGDTTQANVVLGRLQVENYNSGNPCSSSSKLYIPINISTATTTELTGSLAGSGNYYYVCSINIGPTAGAQNFALVEDDSDGCGSVTAGMAGGTTAGTGWNFPANGGIVLGNGGAPVARTAGTNRVICAVTSAAVQTSGHLTVVAAP